jgi:O-antigen/teichoic acid export membrane protein
VRLPNINICQFATSALLNTIPIPKYGISGAAIATAISLAMMNLVSAGLVYWKLSIITLPISKEGFIREK